MNIGVRLNDNRPCAMVLPPGISAFARSWSTWIHCSSQVASANWLIRSCVTSIQSLTPISVPTADLMSVKSSNTRMAATLSELHFRNVVGNEEAGLCHRHNLADADTRRGFKQCGPAAGKADYRHVGHDKVDLPRRGQWQVALLDDLRFSLGRVLHGNDNPLGAADEIHSAAHARHHLARDHPVGEKAVSIDLEATEHGDVNMTAADKT